MIDHSDEVGWPPAQAPRTHRSSGDPRRLAELFPVRHASQSNIEPEPLWLRALKARGSLRA
jgi:hypothetical protein